MSYYNNMKKNQLLSIANDRISAKSRRWSCSVWWCHVVEMSQRELVPNPAWLPPGFCRCRHWSLIAVQPACLGELLHHRLLFVKYFFAFVFSWNSPSAKRWHYLYQPFQKSGMLESRNCPFPSHTVKQQQSQFIPKYHCYRWCYNTTEYHYLLNWTTGKTIKKVTLKIKIKNHTQYCTT